MQSLRRPTSNGFRISCAMPKREKVRFLLGSRSRSPARLMDGDGESFYEMNSVDRDSAVIEGVV